MARRIVIIQGHPDAQARHFGHALADEYAKGAQDGGHEVRRIEVAGLDFPLLRTKEEFEERPVPDSIRRAQEAISWADHLVILYPLWHGTMPALLKAFFEQAFRYGFAAEYRGPNRFPKELLAGRSGRIIVTMGMPAFVYKWFYGAHGLKNLKSSILGFAGIGPVKETLIGHVDGMNGGQRAGWLDTVRALGERGG